MKTHFGIKVKKKDGGEKLIDNVSIPVFRGTLDTLRHCPDTTSAVATMFFEFGEEMFEVELTEEQICQLNLQSFKKAEPKKPWRK